MKDGSTGKGKGGLARRAFLRAGLAAATLPVLQASPAHAHEVAGDDVLRPPRLRPGDTVGIVTPSGHFDEEGLQRCVRNMESLGLRAKLGRHVLAARGNFAGTIAQRLDDLHAMFADPEVKGVWAAHGGSGAIGLLPHVDYGLIRRHPKVLIGLSDVTALLNAVHRRAGIVTFHGPTASSAFTETTTRWLRAVLMEPQPQLAMTLSASHRQRAAAEPQFGARTLAPGVAEGRLVGGNLALVSAMTGALHAPSFERALVFLEDINEPPYKLDRMFHQLKQGGALARAAGVMLGVFEKCGPPDSDPSLTLAETVDEHFAGGAQPAVYGWSFGHVRDQWTLPLGVRARFDAAAGMLTLLEPAVA